MLDIPVYGLTTRSIVSHNIPVYGYKNRLYKRISCLDDKFHKAGYSAKFIYKGREYMKDEIKQDDTAILFSRNGHSVNSHLYDSVKRIGDVFLSILLFLVMSPLMCIIAVLIKIDSPGPVIFSQERLGKDGAPFVIYKFRSMRVDAEIDGPKWASKDDDRCTRVGKILRKARLDEIPQLLNILEGDMSFVGPRPERSCFYQKFETYIPGFKNRLAVKPGLTGLAQVNGGYDLCPEEKIVYDMKYIEHKSIRLDMECMLKTFILIFTHKGAR